MTLSDPHLARRAAEALAALVAAAHEAGALALPDFREGRQTSARIKYKDGGSPVTEADLRVDEFLKTRLGVAFPQAGWLSEETADDARRLSLAETLVVDPIDGTRGFIAGDPRWTVALALVLEGRPIAGVVYAPALGKTFAAALGQGATLNGAAIAASSRARLDGAKVGGPKPLVVAVAAAGGVAFATEPKIPSLAYRFALVAEGALDAGLASMNAHDWDVAAADILLAEAGAALADAQGLPLVYNQKSSRRGALAAAPRALIGEFASSLGRAIETGRRHDN